MSFFFLIYNYDNYEGANHYKASYERFFGEIKIKNFVKNNNDISTKQDTKKDLNKIEAAGTQVVGISFDSVETLKKFSDSERIQFSLLSDEH